MKYKSATALFPSPDTTAEKIAEEIYYAEPDTRGGSDVVIPKTAPVIERALSAERQKVWDEAIAIMKSRLCCPYIKGDCVDCDGRMLDIAALEKARETNT